MIASERPCQTVAENLRFVEEKEKILSALKNGQIAEAAWAMATATENGAYWEEKRAVWQQSAGMLQDRGITVALAGAYYDALKKQNKYSAYEGSDASFSTVCYLRNRGSDGAFDCITAKMTGVRAMYASGHEEALENCYDEYSDACILPYSDPERGLHMGFRIMIARYGLKIERMVRVENREGTAMDFVLLHREAKVIKEQGYLALTLPTPEPQTLLDALSAAAAYGLVTVDVTKLPETFSASESYDLHFFAGAEDAQKYLFYLALNHPGFDLLGVYRKERETI